MKKKVNILGTEYKIDTTTELKDMDGACDWTIQTLSICSTLFEHKQGENLLKDIPRYIRKVTRHEVLHAMLFESGLAECSDMQKEIMIDWLARMYPKMKAIFKELEIET